MSGYENNCKSDCGGGNGRGADGSCVCLKCGYREAKKNGISCMQKKCPICGSILMHKSSKLYYQAVNEDI